MKAKARIKPLTESCQEGWLIPAAGSRQGSELERVLMNGHRALSQLKQLLSYGRIPRRATEYFTEMGQEVGENLGGGACLIQNSLRPLECRTCQRGNQKGDLRLVSGKHLWMQINGEGTLQKEVIALLRRTSEGQLVWPWDWRKRSEKKCWALCWIVEVQELGIPEVKMDGVIPSSGNPQAPGRDLESSSCSSVNRSDLL